MIHLLDFDETSLTDVGRSHDMIEKLLTRTCFAFHDNEFTNCTGNRNDIVMRVTATDVSIEDAIKTHRDDETNR